MVTPSYTWRLATHAYDLDADGHDTLGGVTDLAGLSDVAITAPAENDTLRYVGGFWVNDNRRWEPVTFDPGTGPEIVFTSTDIVMTWETY